MNPADFANAKSETAKFRELTVPYCQGSVIDIGAGGDPVVPWAITIDLPEKERNEYGAGHEQKPNLEGYGSNLYWFTEKCIDTVYSSHLLEDFEKWDHPLYQWMWVIKPGGHLVILIPDKKLWDEAVAAGQPANAAHRHEGFPGELSAHIKELSESRPWLGQWTVLHDYIVEGTYTILFVAQRESEKTK